MLILEDRADDAELLLLELRRSGIELDTHFADNERDYLDALDWAPDVILADYSLPGFTAPQALQHLQDRGLDIPFIVVTGSIGEETAVDIVKRGAADYLLKDRIGRVGEAIRRAINERTLRREAAAARQRAREIEEGTRFALESARVGTWEIDYGSGGARWSAVLEQLHGIRPGSFAGTFDAFLGHIHPEDRGPVIDALANAGRDRTDSNILYRTVWPDGSVHWISSTGRTFYDEAGRPVRAAGIGTDVTARLALEEQYRQAHKMEAIGQLAGGVAHDFNNLLTVIRGYTEMVREDFPDNPFQSELAQIAEAGERATALTRQLLAFSRRQILEVRVFDMRDTVRVMAPMLGRLIGEHIKITIEVPDSPAYVRADGGQIEQVMLNLALNARDAMPHGGTLSFGVAEFLADEAWVRANPDMSVGRYIRTTVRDTGIGMSAATMSRMFEPFFTTKSKDKGTGLGLSTAYGIVKQSDGHILVESELGAGTTFSVYLPLATQVVVEVQEACVPVEGVPARSSETVLVVEDDPAIRDLIQHVLTRHGLRVLSAGSPSEAVRVAHDTLGEIDLLLSDVVLPEVSGKALADSLSAVRPNLRVLYMSGHTDDAIVHHGVLDEGTAFIQKPFTPFTLWEKVRESLAL